MIIEFTVKDVLEHRPILTMMQQYFIIAEVKPELDDTKQ